MLDQPAQSRRVRRARFGSRARTVRSIATLPPEHSEDPKAEPSYHYQSHLFLVELNDQNAPPRQITFGDREDGSPRLSPDSAHSQQSRQPFPAACFRCSRSARVLTLRIPRLSPLVPPMTAPPSLTSWFFLSFCPAAASIHE